MELCNLLKRSGVESQLAARTKEQAIREILEGLYKRRAIGERASILQSLLQREQLGSTAIGDGVALPHARVETLPEAVLFVAVSREGVDFQGADGVPCRLIILFLIPATDTSLSLKILSQLAKLTSDKDLCSRLIGAGSNEKLYSILEEAVTPKSLVSFDAQ